MFFQYLEQDVLNYCHFIPQNLDIIAEPQFEQLPDDLTERIIAGIELRLNDSPF